MRLVKKERFKTFEKKNSFIGFNHLQELLKVTRNSNCYLVIRREQFFVFIHKLHEYINEIKIYLRINIMNILEIRSKMILSDSELRLDAFEGSMHTVSLWKL